MTKFYVLKVCSNEVTGKITITCLLVVNSLNEFVVFFLNKRKPNIIEKLFYMKTILEIKT